MNLLFIQIIFLLLSLIASFSFLLIVTMISFKNKMNQLFIVYMFFQICWLISSIGLRFTVAHQKTATWDSTIYNPSIWLTLAGFSLIVMTLYLYRFSYFFVRKNSRFFNMFFIILNISVISLFIVHLHTPLFYNPHLNFNGYMTIDYHWGGLAGSLFFNLLWIISLVNLWKVRHMEGIHYLIISILIYGGGILLGGSRLIKFPSMPIAVLISNIFLGYVIIGKRILSPLREKSMKLEREMLKRINLEKNIHTVKKDRSLLLNEVHHRVRNNLQIISSLAHFHSAFLDTHNSQAVLQRFQDLMHSMSFVHNYIYENNDLSKINFSQFMNDVINNIRMTTHKSDTPLIKQNIKNINLPLNKAIPCGMVLYELILNVYKHAFPDSYKGKPILYISLQNINAHSYEIIVKDNGIGLSKNCDFNNINSIGLKLVKIIVEKQLEGSIEVVNGKGVMFKLLFENK